MPDDLAVKWWMAALLVLVAACGAEQSAVVADGAIASPTTAATTSTSVATASLVPVEPLTSYRFIMEVSVAPTGGTPTIVARLDGATTMEPAGVHIFGDLHGESLDLLNDGVQWWDLADPDLELTAEDIAFFLGANGFLQPQDVAGLLGDGAAWLELGTDEHLGIPVTHLRRTDIVKDRDWEYGDLAALDVWLTSDGAVVELTAQWATGDNDGFPTSTWRITERNPDLSIPAPPS